MSSEEGPVTDVPSDAKSTRTVVLPEEVVRAIEQRIRGTSFESADAFVAFVMARLLEHPAGDGFSEEEERVLKERLRSLGYID
jgi:Arc/MetJ-type ribon-helix-helix transcriptional regulator